MSTRRPTSSPAFLTALMAILTIAASAGLTSAAVAADRYVVLTKDVDVRSGPGASYYSTARLKAGEVIQVASEKRGWLGVYVDSPGMADRYGLVRLRPNELDALEVSRARQRENGRSFRRATVMAPLFVVAPNIDENDEPAASWRHILRLERGDGLRVIGESTRIGTNRWYRVLLPAAAEVWIEDDAVRAADETEIASLEQYRVDPTGAIAAAEAAEAAAAARRAAMTPATPDTGRESLADAVARPETDLTDADIPSLRPPADTGGSIEMGGNRSAGATGDRTDDEAADDAASGTLGGTPTGTETGNGRRSLGDAVRALRDDAAATANDTAAATGERMADAVEGAGTVGESLLDGGSRAAETARDLITDAGRDPITDPTATTGNEVVDQTITDATDAAGTMVDEAAATGTGLGTGTGTETGTDSGPAVTNPATGAGADGNPGTGIGADATTDRSGSDAAAALPPRERLEALEASFNVLRAGDVTLAEVGPLRRLYEAYAADVAAEHPEKARYARARISQLTIWGDLQAERERIAALRRDLNETGVVVADASKRITREAGFTAVGRLSTSRIFDGATLPKFLRLEAIDSNRTIAYLRTDNDARLAARVGQIVGVSGRKTWDPGLQLDLIDVTEVRDLEMDEAGSITVRVDPGGRVNR